LDEIFSLLREEGKIFEQIINKEQIIAIIIYNKASEPGIHFLTPDDFSQQLAYMHHPAGKVIDPHVHNPVPRQVHYTQEVLFIKRGKLRVDFYNDQRDYLESRVLREGDVILLASGGHGFEVLEELEMIEVKQGPYAGEMDKTRIESVSPERIYIRGNK
jgi:mannose-6-phosphate isomerase-like protein (cupin superfamily)